MRTTLLILLMICWCLGSPVSEHGALSFNDDGYIVDEKNNVVQIRGMSMFWDKWGYESFYNENVIKTLASTSGNGWGASVVRAAISEKSVTRAKNMIDWAMKYGIYIIVDNHSHCAHKETDATGSFFADVSKYVNEKGYNGKVLYELYNEPLYENCGQSGTITSWSTIKTFAEKVIPKIRQNDKKGMILVGTPYYSQGIGYAGDDPIKNVENVGYVLHFYASDEYHDKLKNALRRARCKKIPTFITEWGVSQASGDGNLDWTRINSWMSWVEGLGFSWANWSVSDKGESSAAISGGGSNGDWSEGQLTSSGKYVRKLIKGLNAGQSLSSVGLSTPTYESCATYEGSSEYSFVRMGIGEFGKRIDAEDYLDSNNIETKTDKNTDAFNGMYITTTNSSGAWTTYQMDNVPADGYYVLGVKYLAGNGDLTLKYSVNGAAQSIKLEKTTGDSKFAVTFAPIPLKEGSVLVKFDLGGVSASDLKFDSFWVTAMDSADSVEFGFLEVDEDGNRIVKDKPIDIPDTPIDDSDDEEDDYSDAVFAGKVRSGVNMLVHGRLLEFSGAENGAALNVFDLQGAALLKRSVHGSGVVDLSQLHPGAYVVQMRGAGISKTMRIQLR